PAPARPPSPLPPLGGPPLPPAPPPRREPKAAEARFASAEELLRLAGQEGLFCYDGPRLPKPCSGYFLTDRPRDPEELETLCKGCCGRTPGWEGVLWARDVGAADGQLHVGPPEIGGPRGPRAGVRRAGDERLPSRVEAAYRRRADRPPVPRLCVPAGPVGRD